MPREREAVYLDFIVLGGDARMSVLAKLLRQQGYTARHLQRPTADAANVVVNCPVGGDLEVLEDIPAGARVFTCGPGYCDDPRVTDLWRDEVLQMDNAWLTAEGALCAAMQAGRRSIREMRALVIGWGRIGGALTELLVAMGTKVTVASRQAAHRNRAIERGAEAVSVEELPSILSDFDLAFNTAPAMILDDELLKHANREAMVIDLASAPYGVDLRAAWSLGLRAWREPGLPGRYCPESAAAALYRAIQRGGADYD